jgi:hypothetical protein
LRSRLMMLVMMLVVVPVKTAAWSCACRRAYERPSRFV